jgi:hypothetical protein
MIFLRPPKIMDISILWSIDTNIKNIEDIPKLHLAISGEPFPTDRNE